MAAAFYLGAEDRDYIVMKSAMTDQFPVAVHEYIHLLVKHAGIAAPVWFNEGLAEFYSNLKPYAGKIEVGALIVPHLLLLQRSKWIDVSTLLAVGHDSPLYNEKTHAGLFYAECWALVHMLYLDTHYSAALPTLLAGIKSGADMPETFAKAYGKTPEQVQKDLDSYVRANTFNARLFNAKLAKEVDTPAASESSALEAGLVLAEILANTRAKAGAARELYGRLSRENPKDWQVEQGLARLSLREGNRADAATHYARAAELGSTNGKMYLDYGRLLRAEGKHAEAVAVLKRATEIDPENRDTRLELGYAYIIDNQQAEALAQFQLVKKVSAEQAFSYFHALAYAYYRLERRDEAKQPRRPAATTPRPRTRLRGSISWWRRSTMFRTTRRSAAIIRTPASSDQPPPRLRRRAGTAVAEGTLKQIDCLDGKIRMRIGVGADTMAFALLDLSSIETKGGATLEFACGPQKPRKIRIEYEAKEAAMPGTIGVARSIEFPE